MWEYNFSDYLIYCDIYGLKPSKYDSLINYKVFYNWVIRQV